MSDQHGQLMSSSVHITMASNSSPTSGEIQHVSYLSDHVGYLFLNDDYSDVTLSAEGTTFRAHKVILACRSDYFRALLYGGLRESCQDYVELKDTDAGAFKMLLKYIYTGRLSLNALKEELVLDILGLSHKYGFLELEAAISDYLRAVLNAKNVCTIFAAAYAYDLTALGQYCLDFADRHATEVLSSEGFLHLPSIGVVKLISRDSFSAPEVDIFRAAREWTVHNDSGADAAASIFASIRLPLMRIEELLNIVRPSGLVQPDLILDAIKEQTEKRDMELRYRGLLLPDVNVAAPAHGAQVVEGELRTALLNGDSQNYDMERGFTRHPIEETSEGIIVQLGMPCIINHVKFLLWDKDQRSYSYYVEVSMNRKDWVRVIDYSRYLCRSWQKLYFMPRVVKFVRVMGTFNTVNRVFHLVSFETAYTTTPQSVDSNGVIIPTENVSTIVNSACVLEGVSRSRNALLNGDTEHYDWDSGYTCHQLGSGAIVVQLPQPYLIDSMRLLLWDCDDRSYSYYVEASTNQQQWVRVSDKTNEPCKSWQLLRFEPTPISFVRIVGTHNTANEVFHCVHFECPATVRTIEAKTSAGASTN